MTPSREMERTRVVPPRKIPRGMDALAQHLHGTWKRIRVFHSKLEAAANAAHESSESLRAWTDGALRHRIMDFKRMVRRSRVQPESVFAQALPYLSEAASRRIHLVPYRVQLMGALSLVEGNMTEMATGEGKTLTIALAAAFRGWTRLPFHVVTANDYLAERDAAQLKPFYDFCGVETASVTSRMNVQERREKYDCDVVYTTGKELLADFLRDRLALGQLQNPNRRMIRTLLRQAWTWDCNTVQRGIHSAIVDEADNLLIDEAVTPLIISQLQDNPYLVEGCGIASRTADNMEPGVDFSTDDFYREVRILTPGLEKIHRAAEALDGVYRNVPWMQELVEQALKARSFFARDKHYVVEDEKVVIVDEFTGRLMHGRQWKQGLHQAVEAKEGVPITQPTETLSGMSFQTFFRLFHRLAGITGTARETAGEIWQVYGMPLAVIPRNRPNRQQRLTDRVFSDADAKWEAIVQEIRAVHALGRPILVGTRSVASSEHLAALLQKAGLSCHVLNAIRHREEAQIISMAGRSHTITIATNMAGRGTDIRLEKGVSEIGGLHVIATEMHAAGRIDRQLFGRSARQGDPGSCRLYSSMDDEMIRNFLPSPFLRLLRGLLRARLPGTSTITAGCFQIAQRRAERFAYRQRRSVIRQDAWIRDHFSQGGSQIPI